MFTRQSIAAAIRASLTFSTKDLWSYILAACFGLLLAIVENSIQIHYPMPTNVFDCSLPIRESIQQLCKYRTVA